MNKGNNYDLLLTLIKSFKTISILMNEGNNHEKDKIRVIKGLYRVTWVMIMTLTYTACK